MKKITLILACATLFFASCSEEIEVEKTTLIKTFSMNAEDSLPLEPTRIKGIGHSGNYGYRADSLNQYSAGMYEIFNDSLINSSIRVCVDFWVKSSNPLKGDGLALSYVAKDSTLVWLTYDPITYGAKPNEWINIKDSVTFHADKFKEPGTLVKLFGFNASKQTVMDFDDINVKIKKVYTVLE